MSSPDTTRPPQQRHVSPQHKTDRHGNEAESRNEQFRPLENGWTRNAMHTVTILRPQTATDKASKRIPVPVDGARQTVPGACPVVTVDPIRPRRHALQVIKAFVQNVRIAPKVQKTVKPSSVGFGEVKVKGWIRNHVRAVAERGFDNGVRGLTRLQIKSHRHGRGYVDFPQ